MNCYNTYVCGPDKAILKLHKNLRKAESSILIQLRTGKVGLARFLCKRRVPGYGSPRCRCGRGVGTPVHFLLQCDIYAEQRRRGFGDLSRRTFRDLIDSPELVAVAAKWAIRTGELQQFELASRLLYGEGSEQRGERDREGSREGVG